MVADLIINCVPCPCMLLMSISWELVLSLQVFGPECSHFILLLQAVPNWAPRVTWQAPSFTTSESRQADRVSFIKKHFITLPVVTILYIPINSFCLKLAKLLQNSAVVLTLQRKCWNLKYSCSYRHARLIKGAKRFMKRALRW